MDRKIIALASAVIIFAAVVIYNLWSIVSIQRTVVENNLPSQVKNIVAKQMAVEQEQNAPELIFGSPLDRAGERITKKPFGIFITPQNSPVKPERFRGFHTGTDFETFPEEQNVEISVKAVCEGNIAQKKSAGGYGGMLVQNCELDGQPITIIYGHLKLASISKKAGDALAKGEEIGILGKANSSETSGERKHLHLAIGKNSAVDIRGYVQKQTELEKWIDPCDLQTICR